jgi:DNA-binding transcriptional MerR regulator
MKISELSAAAGVPSTTIRLYREKGFLHPVRLANGYYDYGPEDFVTLSHLRKLRSYGLSTPLIARINTMHCSDRLLDQLRSAEEHMASEIVLLQEQQHWLELECRHIEEGRINRRAGAILMQSIDEKEDYYRLSGSGESSLDRYYDRVTTVLRVPMEVLNGPVEDREIPLQVGLGTYRYIMAKIQEPIPTPDVICPNGLYISQLLILENCRRINILDLAPMMHLAKEKGKTFCSDTTACLLHIERTHEKSRFYFRIRACIEPNDKVEPLTLK